MSIPPPAKEVEALILSLSPVSLSAAENLAVLVKVDWSNDAFTTFRAMAANTVLDVLSLNHPDSVDDAQVPLLAMHLQLLGMMPKNVVGEEIGKRPSSARVLGHLLNWLLHCLENYSDFFPMERLPATMAATLAGSVVGRLIAYNLQLFKNTHNAALLIGISYNVWTWAQVPFGSAQWSTLTWKVVGRVGTILLRTVLMDIPLRRAFGKYCNEERGLRWHTAVAWLGGRGVMLKMTGKASLGEVASLVDIVRCFADLSPLAARLLLDGEVVTVCISLLNRLPHITSDYLATAATLIHAICYTLQEPVDADYLQTTRKLLKANILVITQEVTLYTDPKDDDEAVLKSWDYLQFLVSCMMDHKTIPRLHRAFKALPSVHKKFAAPVPYDIWLSIKSTLNVFMTGHRLYKQENVNGVCDNMLCHKLAINPKCCSACKRALYCDELCQATAWTHGHMADCRLYRNEAAVLPPKETNSNRIYLLHVLGVLVHTTSSVPITPDTCSLFNIGPTSSVHDRFPLNDFRAFVESIIVPKAFLAMLDLMLAKPSLHLAVMGVSDGEKNMYHMVGLFEESVIGTTQYYRLTKGMEVSGLQPFFNKSN